RLHGQHPRQELTHPDRRFGQVLSAHPLTRDVIHGGPRRRYGGSNTAPVVKSKGTSYPSLAGVVAVREHPRTPRAPA
ncbi:MAG TPA: hypothetical protein VK698_37925, partial [Kofleriaceae bacterium]|nr:hypothetical protein [Kofleriaceae bacterium]